MSSPNLTNSAKPRASFRKPRADIYTVLLVLALVAILIGLTFLVLEMDMYSWDFKGGPTAPPVRPGMKGMGNLLTPIF